MNVLELLNDIVCKVEKWWNEETERPLTISIMGQTGVGKSSLINSLFGTDLYVDPVSPGTLKIEERHVKGKSGHDVTLFDLPGIGESHRADEKYLKEYKQKLLDSDVVIWAILADSRSFTFDRDALDKALDTMNEEERITLMSKIIFVLTKVDLLTPIEMSPWIFYHDGSEGVFAMMKPLEELIRGKEEYFQKAFIEPFKNSLRSQTYWSGKFDVKDSRIHYEKSIVSFNGFLSIQERDKLKKNYSMYKDVFDRLYDQYRVIPCSSRFMYNLDFLMRVITDKLESRSTGQFGGFVVNGRMDKVPYVEARNCINIVFVDESQNHKFKGNVPDLK